MAREGCCTCRQPSPFLPADHRQSSHHIHHPLSTHLPPDTRRRKTPQGPGRKPRRRPGASPTGETPTIEEGEEDEDEANEAEGARAPAEPSIILPSSVQVREDPGSWGPHVSPGLASAAHLGSCCSSFSRRMKVLIGRWSGPAHLHLHCCPTKRQLLGPPKGPRRGKYTPVGSGPSPTKAVGEHKRTHKPWDHWAGVQALVLPLTDYMSKFLLPSVPQGHP